jgi:hypothetical protein
MATPYTTGLQFKVQDTADRVLDGSKTVTRRKQGRRVGALSRAYRRHQTTGDPPFAVVRILSSAPVPLVPMTPEEVAREGFPGKSPDWFYGLYRGMYGLGDDENPTTYRIEFELVKGGAA